MSYIHWSRHLLKLEQNSQIIQRRCLDHDLVHPPANNDTKILRRSGLERSDTDPIQSRRDVEIASFLVRFLSESVAFKRLNLSRELKSCYSVRGNVHRYRISLIEDLLADTIGEVLSHERASSQQNKKNRSHCFASEGPPSV